MINVDALKEKLATLAGTFKDPITNDPKFTWEELDALYDYACKGYEAAFRGESRLTPEEVDNKYKWLFWVYGWDFFHDEQKQEELAP